MSTFRTSAPVDRAFMTRRYWQHPSRREHVHGPVQSDLPKSNRLWLWMQIVIYSVCSVYALKLAVMG